MRPLALFAFLAILLGCFACTTGGKAPAPTNPFYTEGARALARADQLTTRGCNQGAVEFYFKAVELFTLADDQEARATCFNNMGNLYLGEGQTADALHYYREAQALHTRNGNLEGRVRVLTNMAAAYLADPSPAKAEESLNQAESLMTQGEIAWPQARVVRANLLLHTGNPQGALGLLLEAESSPKASEVPLTASLHFALGRSLFALNRHAEALTHFSKALHVDRKRGALGLMVKDLREMGRTLGAMDHPTEATRVLERALGIASLLGAESQLRSLQKMIIDLPGDAKGSPSSVTDYFIERWTSGEIFTAPCN